MDRVSISDHHVIGGEITQVEKKCPAQDDSLQMVLSIVMLVISVVILYFFHWGLSVGFVAFWVLFIFVFMDRYLCQKCIYKLGEKVQSAEEYNEKYGDDFNHRLTVSFPLLLFNWFFAVAVGLVLLFFNFSLIPVVITLVVIQSALSIYSMKRTSARHCNNCLFREYCVATQR